MRHKNYTLTEQAEKDLQEAIDWSLKRWNSNLTNQYFDDIHEIAQSISTNQNQLQTRTDLSGDTGLHFFPAREHYIVYLPYRNIIVSVIRQIRDIPTILKKRKHSIQQSVKEILYRIEKGLIIIP